MIEEFAMFAWELEMVFSVYFLVTSEYLGSFAIFLASV